MKKRFITVLIAAAFVVSIAAYVYSNRLSNTDENENLLPKHEIVPLVYGSGDLSIHFLELGNKYTGECIYINYGETDILIDAGSRQSSAATISAYIDNYIQDKKLEYVIATHAHQDHIAAFYSRGNITGIFDYYETGVIIDFPKTNSTTVTYNSYVDARNNAVAKGAVHYNALQCYNNTDGAQRVYELGGNIKLEILYNYYYENYSANENNYSVCIKIIHGDKQYLFTGDLEKEGEEKLVDFYEENFGGLGTCVLFKAGHHGSYTSGSEKLMAAIRPEYIVVCAVAGTSEYRASAANVFPSQDFINRAALYTDNIFFTTLTTDYANNKYESYNGNVVFAVSGGNISVSCSSNNLKLKESQWFINNRIMPDAWK